MHSCDSWRNVKYSQKTTISRIELQFGTYYIGQIGIVVVIIRKYLTACGCTFRFTFWIWAWSQWSSYHWPHRSIGWNPLDGMSFLIQSIGSSIWSIRPIHDLDVHNWTSSYCYCYSFSFSDDTPYIVIHCLNSRQSSVTSHQYGRYCVSPTDSEIYSIWFVMVWHDALPWSHLVSYWPPWTYWSTDGMDACQWTNGKNHVRENVSNKVSRTII